MSTETKSNVTVSDKVSEIFNDIKPVLNSKMLKYNIKNRQTVIDSWLTDLYFIARRFDMGELSRKVKDNGQMVEYDATKHTEEDFIDSFKGYAIKSFTNFILKELNHTNRYVNVVSTDTESDSHTDWFVENQSSAKSSALNLQASVMSGLSNSMISQEAFFLSELIEFLETDIEKAKNKFEPAEIDYVRIAFLDALLIHFNAVLARDGNINVVRDIETTNNRKFFDYEFRSEIEPSIRKILLEKIVSLENPFMIMRLESLAMPENSMALQKRLFRYLFKYKKGIPERARRSKGIK